MMKRRSLPAQGAHKEKRDIDLLRCYNESLKDLKKCRAENKSLKTTIAAMKEKAKKPENKNPKVKCPLDYGYCPTYDSRDSVIRHMKQKHKDDHRRLEAMRGVQKDPLKQCHYCKVV